MMLVSSIVHRRRRRRRHSILSFLAAAGESTPVNSQSALPAGKEKEIKSMNKSCCSFSERLFR